jgi:hypothetical protein
MKTLLFLGLAVSSSVFAQLDLNTQFSKISADEISSRNSSVILLVGKSAQVFNEETLDIENKMTTSLFKKNSLQDQFNQKIKNLNFKSGGGGGGSDSGGGSFLIKNNSLILKDFAGYNFFDSNNQKFKIKTTMTLSLTGFQNIRLENSLYDQLITLSNRQNNFGISKLLRIGLENIQFVATTKKLFINSQRVAAVYKKKMGTFLDVEIFNALDANSQKGLIIHETLRQLSIGFELGLTEPEIEQLTRDIFLEKQIDTTSANMNLLSVSFALTQFDNNFSSQQPKANFQSP